MQSLNKLISDKFVSKCMQKDSLDTLSLEVTPFSPSRLITRLLYPHLLTFRKGNK